MSPETRVEYATSPSFPVLHTEFLDFFPGQIPGKPVVIYESRKAVLSGYDPECIFVRNSDPESVVSLYPSSKHSQGKLLSDPKELFGYYLWVLNQNGKEVGVTKMQSVECGFRGDLSIWVVKENELVNAFPNAYYGGGKFISSEVDVAVIPVINECYDHSGLIFCDQNDLAKPVVQNFLEGLLGGKTRLPLDKSRMDISPLT